MGLMKAEAKLFTLAIILGGLVVWRVASGSRGTVAVPSVESASTPSRDEAPAAAASGDLPEPTANAIRPRPKEPKGASPEPALPELTATKLGVIRGHVRFPNGGPFPKVSVSCQAVDKSPGRGRAWSITDTAEDGSFERKREARRNGTGTSSCLIECGHGARMR